MLRKILTAAAILPLVAIAAPASAAPKPVIPSRSVKAPPPTDRKVSTLTACSPACYSYTGQKLTGTTGLTATKTTSRIAQPYLQTADFHTIAETAIQGGINGAATQNNTIEVGWNIDRTTNGDDLPHLFTFAWYDDGAGNTVGCGYNGAGTSTCGYTDNAANPVNAGSSIVGDLGTEAAFEIYHYAPSAAWIINYKGVQVGRYPDSLNHAAQFTTANYVQNFGELASAHTPDCSHMGNGVQPNVSTAYPTHGAEFRGFNIATGGSYSAAAYNAQMATTPSSWAVYPSGSGEFRYGGSGAGSAQTSPSPCP